MITILFFIFLFLAILYWMAEIVVSGKRQTLQESMNWQSAHYDTVFYNRAEKKEYTINGYDGYILHVEYLKNSATSEKMVIISHGLTDTRFGSLKYAEMYLNLGYDCIIYDLRGHGENKKTATTYGINESRDLICIIEDTKIRFPYMKQLGLHGESLGAATSLTSLKYYPDVDFVIADCGFSDLENVIRTGYKYGKLPYVVVLMINWGMELFYHISIKNMRPIDSLKDNKIPILFIHGAEDKFIVPENSFRMYECTKGKKEIQLIPNAGHAESIFADPIAYQNYVVSFIYKIQE